MLIIDETPLNIYLILTYLIYRGLDHLYVKKFGKVGDYTRILCEKKGLPPGTPLKIYEVGILNVINDIICFQKVLTEKEYVL